MSNRIIELEQEIAQLRSMLNNTDEGIAYWEKENIAANLMAAEEYYWELMQKTNNNEE
jgi:hypothetical protein